MSLPSSKRLITTSIMSGKDFTIIPIREFCTEAFSSVLIKQHSFLDIYMTC